MHPPKNIRGLIVFAGMGLILPAVLLPPSVDASSSERVRHVNIGVDDEPRSVDVKPTYPFDLFRSSMEQLPRYKPEQKAIGTLRMWGSDYIGSHLGEAWIKEFNTFQPEVVVESRLVNALTAIPAIALGVGDLAPSRCARWQELFLFERVHNYPPLEISIATGAFSSGFAIIVHEDNPISRLTMDQLDGIFGAQRTGGYIGTQWHPESARGPEKNIRTWGQLGLTGEWKDKPIHVYGSILNGFFNRHFERLVFKGGVKWNEDFREYETGVTPDGKEYYRQDQFTDDMADDPCGIAFGYSRFGRKPKMKTLPIARIEAGPYVELTIENLHNHSYPLAQNYYVYINRKPGQALEPKVREFMRYILSREGQEAIARHGKYLPLTAEAVELERRKLE
ncbi:MAG: hypothetical protein PHQ04_05685 [Opitutaceae bacterium]|nr:hypothetical protein [Opitutaceae bacterium]